MTKCKACDGRGGAIPGRWFPRCERCGGTGSLDSTADPACTAWVAPGKGSTLAEVHAVSFGILQEWARFAFEEDGETIATIREAAHVLCHLPTGRGAFLAERTDLLLAPGWDGHPSDRTDRRRVAAVLRQAASRALGRDLFAPRCSYEGGAR